MCSRTTQKQEQGQYRDKFSLIPKISKLCIHDIYIYIYIYFLLFCFLFFWFCCCFLRGWGEGGWGGGGEGGCGAMNLVNSLVGRPQVSRACHGNGPICCDEEVDLGRRVETLNPKP